MGNLSKVYKPLYLNNDAHMLTKTISPGYMYYKYPNFIVYCNYYYNMLNHANIVNVTIRKIKYGISNYKTW